MLENKPKTLREMMESGGLRVGNIVEVGNSLLRVALGSESHVNHECIINGMCGIYLEGNGYPVVRYGDHCLVTKVWASLDAWLADNYQKKSEIKPLPREVFVRDDHDCNWEKQELWGIVPEHIDTNRRYICDDRCDDNDVAYWEYMKELDE